MDLVKVRFEIAEEAPWHGQSTETLWAKRLSENEFELRNSPFFVYGVNFEDTVCAYPDDDVSLFVGRTKASGRSTYRIYIKNEEVRVLSPLLEKLEVLGCSYEENKKFRLRILAVDVPREADIHHVYKVLETGLKENVWDFDEGDCGHIA